MGKEFLGRGWAFPVAIDARGALESTEYERDVREAITIILSTAKGERVMRPDFGCGIHDYLFEVVNSQALSLIESSVREALTQWEPRIEVQEVRAAPRGSGGESGDARGPTPEGFGIDIAIRYSVRTTNNQFNVVYPFNLTEGR
jgi:uncharacterized protein